MTVIIWIGIGIATVLIGYVLAVGSRRYPAAGQLTVVSIALVNLCYVASFAFDGRWGMASLNAIGVVFSLAWWVQLRQLTGRYDKGEL